MKPFKRVVRRWAVVRRLDEDQTEPDRTYLDLLYGTSHVEDMEGAPNDTNNRTNAHLLIPTALCREDQLITRWTIDQA